MPVHTAFLRQVSRDACRAGGGINGFDRLWPFAVGRSREGIPAMTTGSADLFHGNEIFFRRGFHDPQLRRNSVVFIAGRIQGRKSSRALRGPVFLIQ